LYKKQQVAQIKAAFKNKVALRQYEAGEEEAAGGGGDHDPFGLMLDALRKELQDFKEFLGTQNSDLYATCSRWGGAMGWGSLWPTLAIRKGGCPLRVLAFAEEAVAPALLLRHSAACELKSLNVQQ
jgi:hypothetical protein